MPAVRKSHVSSTLVEKGKRGSDNGYRSIELGGSRGLAFVATSYGINYLFASKPLRLYLIDAGYVAALMTIMGAILGAWR